MMITIAEYIRAQNSPPPDTFIEMLRRLKYYNDLLREYAERIAGIYAQKKHTRLPDGPEIIHYIDRYRQLLRYKILQLHAIINRKK